MSEDGGEITFAPEVTGGADSPAKNPGVISQLLAVFRKMTPGQDLTTQSLAVPDGFESFETALERFQNAALNHSDLLLKLNDIEDPVLRLIQILKWYFTIAMSFKLKKPLNPILGEVTVCKYHSNQKKEGNKNDGKYRKDDSKDVFYALSEQVSHHPPISAYMAENKERGVRIAGFTRTDIKFVGTAIKVVFEGGSTIAVDKYNEVYTYNPPQFVIKLIGLVLELIGKMEFTCKTHPYVARVTFKEKPVLRGKYHSVKGTIVKVNGKDEEEVVKFKGHWNTIIKFEDLRNKQTYTHNASDYPAPFGIPSYPPYEDELPTSSRKVWDGVKNAANPSDGAKAKREVEEEQRRKAKEREEKKEPFKPVYFTAEPRGNSVWYQPNFAALQSVAF